MLIEPRLEPICLIFGPSVLGCEARRFRSFRLIRQTEVNGE